MSEIVVVSDDSGENDAVGQLEETVEDLAEKVEELAERDAHEEEDDKRFDDVRDEVRHLAENLNSHSHETPPHEHDMSEQIRAGVEAYVLELAAYAAAVEEPVVEEETAEEDVVIEPDVTPSEIENSSKPWWQKLL